MKRKKVEKHHYIETRDIWGEDESADGKSNTPSGSARVPGVGEVAFNPTCQKSTHDL